MNSPQEQPPLKVLSSQAYDDRVQPTFTRFKSAQVVIIFSLLFTFNAISEAFILRLDTATTYRGRIWHVFVLSAITTLVFTLLRRRRQKHRSLGSVD